MVGLLRGEESGEQTREARPDVSTYVAGRFLRLGYKGLSQP